MGWLHVQFPKRVGAKSLGCLRMIHSEGLPLIVLFCLEKREYIEKDREGNRQRDSRQRERERQTERERETETERERLREKIKYKGHK